MVGKFLQDRDVRRKVVKGMQARGIGVGINPDNLLAWIELILKYLPQFLEVIAQVIALFSSVGAAETPAEKGLRIGRNKKDVQRKRGRQ